MKKLFLLILANLSLNAFAQYTLVFEDNFDGDSLNPAAWNIEQQVGIWNTGSNRELEHYRMENVQVGTDTAGNSCLMLIARKEDYQGYAFTSGRIDSRNKLAFTYGKLECRLMLPDIANGLWPGVWMLGNTRLVWPACGEIDIMEAGQKESITAGTQNSRFGGALHWDNAGSYAGYGNAVNASTPLNTGYHIFTLEWSPSFIKMFIDSSTTPYFNMSITAANAEEFRIYEHFMVLNLAVGGMFPDIFTSEGITAPLPATMYIDYIKIYKKEGEGSFHTNLPVIGDLAVFADGKTYANSMLLGYDASLLTDSLEERPGETPREGTYVFSWNTLDTSALKIKIEAAGMKNMSNFLQEGSLDFYLKTGIKGLLEIGLSDTTGREVWISLPDSMGGRSLRDSSWQRVVLPIKDFTGLDLEHLSSVFMLRAKPAAQNFLSLDRIIWSTTTMNFENYGIYTDNPAIKESFVIDNLTNHLYVWENSMSPIPDAPSYDGQNVLAFTSDAARTWYGMGIFTDNGLDFTQFSDGYLHLALRTSSDSTFWLGMGGAGGTEAKLDFISGSDPYGFVRDGKWHRLVIPMADLLSKGINLSACGNIFMLGGEPSISNICFDDIFLSSSAEVPANTALNPGRNNPLNLSDNEIKADYWAVYSENPNVTQKFAIDNSNGFIYIWSNTMATTSLKTTYEGTKALQYRSNGSLGWYGFGIFSKKSLNLTHFANGYLSVALKTSSPNEFYLGVQGASATEGKIVFKKGSDPYGFLRDGKWHQLLIPVSVLVSKGLNLTACGNIFILGGTSISDIGIDDIVFGIDQNFPVNPLLTVTGLHEAKLIGQSVLYPNPAGRQLHVKPADGGRLTRFSITDLAGRMILREDVGPGENELSINLESLSPGLFLLVLESDRGSERRLFVHE